MRQLCIDLGTLWGNPVQKIKFIDSLLVIVLMSPVMLLLGVLIKLLEGTLWLTGYICEFVRGLLSDD